ncbi:type II toxin-antitoxin system RelE/ParE family toxin [Psychrosphaera saromensis]|uniref:type II toxin-antitoxin system RelE/ParE family toxin n=1 Tax=Psychrosphaera saromensis TaxID=716813 RepID=UPI001C613AA3|nr:type II toxin-antitoxin system RelE/ParE family toxin [Psychrosphaera saromensis]
MSNYKLSELAAEDISQIFEFGIDNFGLSVASNYIDGMTIRFLQLAEAPLQYQSVNDIREGIDAVFMAVMLFIIVSVKVVLILCGY